MKPSCHDRLALSVDGRESNGQECTHDWRRGDDHSPGMAAVGSRSRLSYY